MAKVLPIQVLPQVAVTAETSQALHRRQFFVPEADNTLGEFVCNRPEESLKGLTAEGSFRFRLSQ